MKSFHRVQFTPWVLMLSAAGSTVPGLVQAQSRLAFSSNRGGVYQIYHVSKPGTPDQGDQVQVTAAGAANQENRRPDWLRDKDWIAYQFGASGVRGVHQVKADGSGEARLTLDPTDETDPAWSPDGRFIVYARLVASGDYDLWIRHVGSPDAPRADDPGSAQGNDDPASGDDYSLLGFARTQENRPAWSPDGSKIAFVSNFGGDAEIFVLDVSYDGDRVVPILPHRQLTDNTAIDFDPSWSPDSQELAFASTRTGSRDIYVMSLAHGDTDPNHPSVRLTTHDAVDSNPSWSSDGALIAFASERSGNRDIWVMNSDRPEGADNEPVNVTKDPSQDDDPVWEPKNPVEFLDPNPSLRDGPQVTQDLERLAVAGRPVRGLAADGVTPVVVRVPLRGNADVIFSLEDDSGSRDPDAVGTLQKLSGEGGNPLTVSAVQLGESWYAFAVLTAPVDFVRATSPTDAADTSRSLVFSASVPGGETLVRTLQLVRPPVLLLHGIWSDAGTWQWALQSDERLTVYAHDYAPLHAAPLRVNLGQVRQGARIATRALRDRGFATTQVDVVGHSMGGLLTRIHIASAYNARDENFGKGDVHKLITLDTPHLGSPLARWLVSDQNELSWFGDVFTAFGLCADCGAVRDLRPDSMELQNLAPAVVPAHAIVGTGGSDLLEAGIERILESWPATEFLAGTIELLKFFQIIDSIFPPSLQHDVIVGRQSQEGGLGTGSPFTSVVGYDPNALVPSLAIHVTVTSEEATETIALGLLLAKVSDPRFAPGGFPRLPVPIVPEAPGLPFEVPEGGVLITSPSPGMPVRAGTTVTLRAAGANGFLPVALLFVTPFGNKSVAGAPFEAELALPREAAGTVSVVAVAKDAAGEFARSAVIELTVEVPANLTGISVIPESLVFESFQSRQGVEVTGQYDDGADRDLTSAGAGTEYMASDARIVSVDIDGLVTALRVGAASIAVSNGNFSVPVAVTVTTSKGDVEADGVVGADNLESFQSCYSGSLAAQGFKSPTLACAEAFDFDNDSDVDVSDLDALLALYEGPVVDCNQNGALDLRDILAGTSEDADQNGIPDECEGSRLFHRGDADENGRLELTDAIRILGFLFLGGPTPSCFDAADSDDNGRLELTDAIRVLGFLFLGAVPPALPGPPSEPCGTDPTADELDCGAYAPCRA
jgi:Tol biopolymer transport system component/pimeloyl-ACP methyl ester carboxylesterase